MTNIIESYLFEKDEAKERITDCESREAGYTAGWVDALEFCHKKAEKLVEPEKVEIPQFVADWIEHIKTDEGAAADITGGDIFRIIVDMGEVSAFNPASDILFNDYEITDELVNYCSGHEMEFLKALINGYTVKEPVWVVKEKEGSRYLVEYRLSDGHVILVSSKANAYPFKDKQQAESVATLTNNTIEERNE
ncbi:MAG: DUF1642 domain-containing protein [Lactococcus lactis]|nr:DUF1642 domain-containing protein [Lactococcus lactis]